MSNFYFITTAIPYVNSKPHVGFAQELLIADTIARTYRQNGFSTILQTGTDDNAYKNVISAKEVGVDPRDFVNTNAERFEELLPALNIEANFFVRTSSSEHANSVQYFLSQPSQTIFELGSREAAKVLPLPRRYLFIRLLQKGAFCSAEQKASAEVSDCGNLVKQ